MVSHHKVKTAAINKHKVVAVAAVIQVNNQVEAIDHCKAAAVRAIVNHISMATKAPQAVEVAVVHIIIKEALMKVLMADKLNRLPLEMLQLIQQMVHMEMVMTQPHQGLIHQGQLDQVILNSKDQLNRRHKGDRVDQHKSRNHHIIFIQRDQHMYQ